VLAFAGIYEFWHDATKDGDETAWVTMFAIITPTATDDVGRVHDRMPMTIPADQWVELPRPRHLDEAGPRDHGPARARVTPDGPGQSCGQQRPQQRP